MINAAGFFASIAVLLFVACTASTQAPTQFDSDINRLTVTSPSGTQSHDLHCFVRVLERNVTNYMVNTGMTDWLRLELRIDKTRWDRLAANDCVTDFTTSQLRIELRVPTTAAINDVMLTIAPTSDIWSERNSLSVGNFGIDGHVQLTSNGTTELVYDNLDPSSRVSVEHPTPSLAIVTLALRTKDSVSVDGQIVVETRPAIRRSVCSLNGSCGSGQVEAVIYTASPTIVTTSGSVLMLETESAFRATVTGALAVDSVEPITPSFAFQFPQDTYVKPIAPFTDARGTTYTEDEYRVTATDASGTVLWISDSITWDDSNTMLFAPFADFVAVSIFDNSDVEKVVILRR